MDGKPSMFSLQRGIGYPTSWFREPFSLMDAMFYRLYGEENCTHFKEEWVPAAQHIILTGESFNWDQILSINLQQQIEKYLKVASSKKTQFYMSAYVMDVFCSTSAFPNLAWNWQKNFPLVHIYYSNMWENNFLCCIYEICDIFLGSMYHKIFKVDAPAFLAKARDLITFHGYWYVEEYFSYFRIWGSNTVHLLSRIVPDQMVLHEFSFLTVIDGPCKIG